MSFKRNQKCVYVPKKDVVHVKALINDYHSFASAGPIMRQAQNELFNTEIRITDITTRLGVMEAEIEARMRAENCTEAEIEARMRDENCTEVEIEARMRAENCTEADSVESDSDDSLEYNSAEDYFYPYDLYDDDSLKQLALDSKDDLCRLKQKIERIQKLIDAIPRERIIASVLLNKLYDIDICK